jgi:hypothetical protein
VFRLVNNRVFFDPYSGRHKLVKQSVQLTQAIRQEPDKVRSEAPVDTLCLT